MAERFTQRAQRAIIAAQEAASRLGHDFIDPGHILLGILSLGEGVAFHVLSKYSVGDGMVRDRIAKVIPLGTSEAGVGELPFTPDAKAVLEAAASSALVLGHRYVGTEHLLLGLLKGSQGAAKPILEEAGVFEGEVLEAIRNLLDQTPAPLVFVEPPRNPPKRQSRVPEGLAACPHVAGFVELPGIGGASYGPPGLLVFMKAGASPDQVRAELLRAVPELSALPLQFKLPGERPIAKVDGRWLPVQTSPRNFTY